MTKVKCPECQRLLEVPIGHEASISECPACRFRFVPAVQFAPIPQPSAIAPDQSLNTRKRRKQRAMDAAGEERQAIWRQSKQIYAVVVVVLFAISILLRVFDVMQVEFIIVPLLAFPITVIVMLTSGLIFSTPLQGSLPRMRWLVWPFVVGIAAGVAAVGLFWATHDGVLRPIQMILALVILAPISGVLMTLAAIWTITIYQVLRVAARKIQKASQLDDDVRYKNETDSNS